MIVDINKLHFIRNLYKEKSIVLCHGCFDIFHYGHLIYLKESSKLGDLLIVSITGDKYINKELNRPIFEINKRMEIIDSLKCVSFSCISNNFTAVNIIRLLKPNIYCKATDVKGKELDPKENLFHEFNELTKSGGKLVFIEKVPTISSTYIINKIKT